MQWDNGGMFVKTRLDLYTYFSVSLTLDWEETPFKSEFNLGTSGYVAGFWDACCLAFFSYTGGDAIGITAHETERPWATIPKAVRRFSYRISFYYIFSVLMLGLTVSANDPILNLPESGSSVRNYPGGFIAMAERAGIPVLPHLINAVMIIAVLSVATANLFVTVNHPNRIRLK
jgi:yeast amino acid transporter